MGIELYEKYFSTAKPHEHYPDARIAKRYTKEGADQMKEFTLGKVLEKMYYEAPRGHQVASIHLFSIYYASTIEQGRLQKKEILKSAGLPESYQTEISKGMNLAKYVDVKEDWKQRIHEIQVFYEGQRHGSQAGH